MCALKALVGPSNGFPGRVDEISHQITRATFMAIGICLNLPERIKGGMTLEDKVRYGMMALGGASLVFATLGVHFSPLADTVASWGN